MVTKEVNITVLSKMLSEEYESYENKIIKLETVLRSAKVALQGIQKHSQNAYRFCLQASSRRNRGHIAWTVKR